MAATKLGSVVHTPARLVPYSPVLPGTWGAVPLARSQAQDSPDRDTPGTGYVRSIESVTVTRLTMTAPPIEPLTPLSFHVTGPSGVDSIPMHFLMAICMASLRSFPVPYNLAGFAPCDC